MGQQAKQASVINLQEAYGNAGGVGGFANDTVDSFENENNVTQDRDKMVELMINERNSFNNSSIDFIQMQKRIAIENSFENQNKRQIRMFNESSDNEILNNTTDQIKPQSIKIVNQSNTTNQYQQQLHPQQKSLSYGNLSGQQSTSTHNLHITSPILSNQSTNGANNNQMKSKQIPSMKNTYHQSENSNQENNNNTHSMSASMKNLKIQQNQYMNPQSNGVSNGDNSGGDNDSGISSMSSETAAAMSSALNSNLAAQNSFNYIHKPIIMGQMNQQGRGCIIQNNNSPQNNHQIFTNGNVGQNGQQYLNNGPQQNQYFSSRQVYQTNNHNGSSANISMNQNTSTNSVQAKTVLETLV